MRKRSHPDCRFLAEDLRGKPNQASSAKDLRESTLQWLNGYPRTRSITVSLGLRVINLIGKVFANVEFRDLALVALFSCRPVTYDASHAFDMVAEAEVVFAIPDGVRESAVIAEEASKRPLLIYECQSKAS
jgi:hypothetical protein